MVWWIWVDGKRMALEGKAGDHSVVECCELFFNCLKRTEARFCYLKYRKGF